MKKIIVILIAISFILCGCKSDYIETDKRLIVSALGVDTSNGDIVVYVETVKIGENSTDTSYSPVIYKGMGKSVRIAIFNVQNQLPESLSFGHCPILVLSEKLSDRQIDEILNYCISDDEFTLSIIPVCTEKVESMLECNGEGKELVGHKAVELLNACEKNTGMHLSQNLVDVINSINNENKSFILPRFTVSNAKEFSLSGAGLYYNNMLIKTCNLLQSQIIYMTQQRLSGGSIKPENSYEIIALKSAGCDITEYEDRLELKYEITLDTNVFGTVSEETGAELEVEINNTVAEMLQTGINFLHLKQTNKEVIVQVIFLNGV